MCPEAVEFFNCDNKILVEKCVTITTIQNGNTQWSGFLPGPQHELLLYVQWWSLWNKPINTGSSFVSPHLTKRREPSPPTPTQDSQQDFVD